MDAANTPEFWLISYSYCYISRKHNGSKHIGNPVTTTEIIDKHPLDWLIENKKREEEFDAEKTNELYETKTIYSAIPCNNMQEQVAWWFDNV